MHFEVPYLVFLSLNPDVKMLYDFFIKNGKINSNYKLFFTKPANNVEIYMSEKIGQEWAIVDKDDTTDECRLIQGQSNKINIIDSSRNWAGFGTNKSQNDPNKNSINTDIRQNVNKDLHFHKMSW